MAEERYIRQIKCLGFDKQEKIHNATIAIVGIGALGSVAAELLARMGVKKLIIADSDKVEEHNLTRQALYQEKDINTEKTAALKAQLLAINSSINIHTIPQRITQENIHELQEADIILDGTDNMQTRYIIDEFSQETKTPWIYATAAGTIRYLAVIDPNKRSLHDILDHKTAQVDCDHVGVLAPITHTIATLQVTEALKLITHDKTIDKLLRIDIWTNSYESFKMKQKDKTEK